MTRLACLRVAIAGTVLFAAAGGLGGSASASTAVGTYVAVSRVDMLPDDASATSVVIHGAFVRLTANGYTTPECGYMYFQCATGSEAMCRMQWSEVRAYGMPKTVCVGFGQQNVVTTGTATVRPAGTTLAGPDTWDLGIGIVTGVSIGGQCAPARALSCPASSVPTGAGGATGTGGSGAASGAGGGAEAAGTGGGAPVTGAAGTTGSGGARPEALASRSACASAGAPGVNAVGLTILALLGAATQLRRRRR